MPRKQRSEPVCRKFSGKTGRQYVARGLGGAFDPLGSPVGCQKGKGEQLGRLHQVAADREPALFTGFLEPFLSRLFVALFVGLMLIGLIWLMVFQLAATGPDAPSLLSWMANLGPWNYAVAFAFMISGLLLTMRWR